MPASTNKFGLRPKLDTDNMTVIMNVVNKELEDNDANRVVESESFAFNDIPDTLKRDVSLYGLNKFLSDRSSEVETGPGKITEMKAIFARLCAGEWEKERAAGARTVRIEVEALAALQNCSVGEAQASLNRYSKEQREEILAHPSVVEKAAELRAQREAAGTADLSAFLPTA